MRFRQALVTFVLALECSAALADRPADAADSISVAEYHAKFRASQEARIEAGRSTFKARVAATGGSGGGSAANTLSPPPFAQQPGSEKHAAIVLVSFSARQSLQQIFAYASAASATLLAVFRSVGSDQIGQGIERDSLEGAKARWASAFVEHLDERDRFLREELERLGREPAKRHSLARRLTQYDIEAVTDARVKLAKGEARFDGVLLRVEVNKLRRLENLPNGQRPLLIEFESGSRRHFPIPLDIYGESPTAK